MSKATYRLACRINFEICECRPHEGISRGLEGPLRVPRPIGVYKQGLKFYECVEKDSEGSTIRKGQGSVGEFIRCRSGGMGR